MNELLMIAQNSMTSSKYLLAVVLLVILSPFAVIGIIESYFKAYRFIFKPSMRDIDNALSIIEELKEDAIREYEEEK